VQDRSVSDLNSEPKTALRTQRAGACAVPLKIDQFATFV
jgi:hypothetical protein